MADLIMADHGSIVLLRGRTLRGRVWLDEHLDPAAQRWWESYVIEPRYLLPIIEGATDEGLTVEMDR